MNNEIKLHQVQEVDNISDVIKEYFDVDLDISGGWGYDHSSSVIVNSLSVPIDQFLHMFSTIRATIEMNLMLEDNERYGGINVTFIDGHQIEIENKIYDKITFEVTAMKEKDYANFIQEYKDNYGKNKDFDMTDHFNRRKEASISIHSDFWFKGLEEFYHKEEEN
jgi:hypothetical protein